MREYTNRYQENAARTREAQARGREFLLQHHLFKTRDAKQIVDQKFTHFSFPPRWHYEILAALDYFQVCMMEKDDRLEVAINLMKSKRRKDGIWNLQNRHPGKTFFEMEKAGQPVEHAASNAGFEMVA